jgi:hypothetical protein
VREPPRGFRRAYAGVIRALIGAGTVSLSVGTAHSRVACDGGCSGKGAAPKAAPKTAARNRGLAVKDTQKKKTQAKEKKAAAEEEEERCVSLLCDFTPPCIRRCHPRPYRSRYCLLVSWHGALTCDM